MKKHRHILMHWRDTWSAKYQHSAKVFCRNSHRTFLHATHFSQHGTCLAKGSHQAILWSCDHRAYWLYHWVNATQAGGSSQLFCFLCLRIWSEHGCNWRNSVHFYDLHPPLATSKNFLECYQKSLVLPCRIKTSFLHHTRHKREITLLSLHKTCTRWGLARD